ncbi:vWA domain-containing protein [Acinetobacter guillouiae]|uniref:vWA domain-containing protein n=1 Tax=Acinetobacter guillouiae TaxID=106649 RepID=UPI001AE7AAC6|nr:VWA domain-containing protein [Acinetobacter guillouiae]MBP2543129.1 stress response protein SCP2 [Acinetobacter guillouiae]
MQFITGQKLALHQLLQIETQFKVRVQVQAPFEIDISSFGIAPNDKLFHDDYMTFYNQPQAPKGEVQYQLQGNIHSFTFDLNKIDATRTSRFVICATLANEQSQIQNIQSIQVELSNQQGQVVASYVLNGSNFSQEKAVMLTEIYFKSDAWRIAAIGQGFNGGLKALVEHFGGEVEESAAATPSTANPSTSNSASTIDLKKKVVLDKIQNAAPHLVDITKKSLISLEKNNLLDVKARVALVLDYSGSMHQQYIKGDVQKVLDRIMPLAVNFDDDGSFECWAFAEKSLRLSDVTLNNLENFVNTDQGGHPKWKAGARYNNEPAVLEAVIQYFTQENPSHLPVYVVFVSDGGVSESKKIKNILKNASSFPIFWQFVGIGGRNYGVLEQLDTMDGRVVDNCNFFEMSNIQSMPEAQLYDALLQEFPLWLKEAKNKNIIR